MDNILKELKESWGKAKVDPLLPVIQKIKALDLIKNYNCLQNQFLFITDYSENKISLTKGIEPCLGYSHDEFTIHALMSYIHPEDRESILSVVQIAWEELTIGLYGIAPLDWSFTFDYRIKKKDNTYMKILHQIFITDLTEGGQLIKTIDICTDISHVKHSTIPSYKFIGKGQEKFLEKIEKRLQKKKIFSPREMEIISYMSKGYNSKKISEKLLISAETIRTYKKRIYIKSGCHNSSELISFIYQNGVL